MNNTLPYQLEVTLDKKDIEYFLLTQYMQKLFIKILIGLATIMALASLYFLVANQNFPPIQGLILPLVVFVVLPLSIKSQAKKLLNSSNGQFRNNHYTFEEEKITIQHVSGEASFTWNNIFKLEQNKKQFLLYVNNTIAHVIPKSSFQNQQEQEQFLQLVRRKMSQKA